MTTTVPAFASRGDAQPHLALAVGLQPEQVSVWLRPTEGLPITPRSLKQ